MINFKIGVCPKCGKRNVQLMFSNNPLNRKIYVPRASVDAYKAAEYWSNYKSDIVGYDF